MHPEERWSVGGTCGGWADAETQLEMGRGDPAQWTSPKLPALPHQQARAFEHRDQISSWGLYMESGWGEGQDEETEGTSGEGARIGCSDGFYFYPSYIYTTVRRMVN